MSPMIILDTGPLSNVAVTPARGNQPLTASQQCREWIEACEEAGRIILVPSIVLYESLREIERRSAMSQKAHLLEFTFSSLNRFLPLTTDHLILAAKLWGISRRNGSTTASDFALDIDIILCAQTLSLGLDPSEYVVATTNVRHLAQFANCEVWQNIVP